MPSLVAWYRVTYQPQALACRTCKQQSLRYTPSSWSLHQPLNGLSLHTLPSKVNRIKGYRNSASTFVSPVKARLWWNGLIGCSWTISTSDRRSATALLPHQHRCRTRPIDQPRSSCDLGPRRSLRLPRSNLRRVNAHPLSTPNNPNRMSLQALVVQPKISKRICGPCLLWEKCSLAPFEPRLLKDWPLAESRNFANRILAPYLSLCGDRSFSDIYVTPHPVCSPVRIACETKSGLICQGLMDSGLCADHKCSLKAKTQPNVLEDICHYQDVSRSNQRFLFV